MDHSISRWAYGWQVKLLTRAILITLEANILTKRRYTGCPVLILRPLQWIHTFTHTCTHSVTSIGLTAIFWQEPPLAGCHAGPEGLVVTNFLCGRMIFPKPNRKINSLNHTSSASTDWHLQEGSSLPLQCSPRTREANALFHNQIFTANQNITYVHCLTLSATIELRHYVQPDIK